jgi:serine/threonine protein phosphatase 1
MKRYAIGDVHGCLNTLKDLIQTIGPNADDLVIFTGDLVDRGAHSKQVIDYIIDAQDAGYNFQVVCGNHDNMFLNVIKHTTRDDSELFISNGGLNTLRSYDPHLNFDTSAMADLVPDRHIKFLTDLPTYIELDDIILVHAGLRFKGDPLLELMYPSLKKHPIVDALKQTSDEDMMWIRSIDDYDVNLCRGKMLVHGHTVISLDSIKKMIDKGDRIDIDNGCVFGDQYGDDYGRLVALDLDTFAMTTVKKLPADNVMSHLNNTDYD